MEPRRESRSGQETPPAEAAGCAEASGGPKAAEETTQGTRCGSYRRGLVQGVDAHSSFRLLDS